MNIQADYILCLCLSGMIGAVALEMLLMGALRRGESAHLDDGAAWMLIGIGGVVAVILSAFWVSAWGRIPRADDTFISLVLVIVAGFVLIAVRHMWSR